MFFIVEGGRRDCFLLDWSDVMVLIRYILDIGQGVLYFTSF